MEILDCAQNSEEWYQARLGSIGGSSIPKILAKKRGNSESKMRQDLRYQMAAEILTGTREESYSNKYMERGHKYEPEARALADDFRDERPCPHLQSQWRLQRAAMRSRSL